MDRNPTPRFPQAIFWRLLDLLLSPSPTRGRKRIVSLGAPPPAPTLGCCVSSRYSPWRHTNCKTAEQRARSLGVLACSVPRPKQKRMSAMNALDNLMEPSSESDFSHLQISDNIQNLRAAS